MKKYYLPIFVAFIVALSAGFFLKMISKPKTQRSVQTHHVSLLKNKASPSELIVKLGETVQFDSRDGKNHDIAQGPGNEFKKAHDHPEGSKESGPFGPNEGYKISFTKPGTYHFHDHLNPKIFVAVVVYDPSKKK